MDTSAVVTIATGIFTAVGGFAGGRRMAASEANSAASTAMAVANTTVDMLKTQIEGLQRREQETSTTLDRLSSRIIVLEGLVTQRADVETVKSIVRIIAEKVGADVAHLMVDPPNAGPNH